ncbi:MAG: hypothetical protein IPH20_18950 [Bacteroidales bacterium]|nr:hypothetical protein [Bacteroidales bacterium]
MKKTYSNFRTRIFPVLVLSIILSMLPELIQSMSQPDYRIPVIQVPVSEVLPSLTIPAKMIPKQ